MSAAAGFLRQNSLSLVLLSLFLGSVVLQSVAGFREHAREQIRHGSDPGSYREYVLGGEFWSTVMENWESEFLQMGAFIWLTVFLRQKGSPESKPLDKKIPQDEDPRRHRDKKGAPWPVKRGGWVLTLYEHSLSLTLLLLFFVSFALHARASQLAHNQEAAKHGAPLAAFGEYLTSARLWFESFQNWQSEFLSVAVLVILAVFLRERGSPESKPVAEPHASTGTE